MFKTAITEMFGIRYPIICGAMMWLCKPRFCAAISNAGGMGNLTAGNMRLRSPSGRRSARPEG